jgi:hypothetical protein
MHKGLNKIETVSHGMFKDMKISVIYKWIKIYALWMHASCSDVMLFEWGMGNSDIVLHVMLYYVYGNFHKKA